MGRLLLYVLAAVLAVASSNAPTHAASQAMQRSLAALAAKRGPFTFAVIGDNRSGDRVYAKIIKGTMARRPDFVVNTGDVIPNPGNREEWRNFWEISKGITVPYFLVVGNHDVDDKESEVIWQEEVDLPENEIYFSFAVGRNLFVILDTCEPDQDRRVAGKQFKWLKGTLDPSRYEHQFVFLHHPLFLWKGASHYRRSLDRYPELRDRLHKLFLEKGVDAVFAGHEHTFKREIVDGIHYIITGGAGAPLYSGFNNFMILEVNGPIVSAKVLDREGYLRDEFFISGP